MRSAEHRAEAERQLMKARDMQTGDPQTILVLQLAQTHALLALIPEPIDAAEVALPFDVADVVRDARRIAADLATLNPTTSPAVVGHLVTLLADAVEVVL